MPAHLHETLLYHIAESPLGWVLLATAGQGVRAVLLGDNATGLLDELRMRFPRAQLIADTDSLAAPMQAVLRRLQQPDAPLELPIAPGGTTFQQRVWQALGEIPSGQTVSYGELASRLGSHPRAIAKACASNPLAVLVPCHRVVDSRGGLTGYRWGLARKAALLALEREYVEGSLSVVRRSEQVQSAQEESAMTELKRYCVHYRLNGEPRTLILEEFEEPGFARVENAILLEHVPEPRAATDQPWEDPEVPSEQARLVELGVSDIRIEQQP